MAELHSKCSLHHTKQLKNDDTLQHDLGMRSRWFAAGASFESVVVAA